MTIWIFAVALLAGAELSHAAVAVRVLLGVLTVIGTLLSDLLLMWLDPRIRLEG